jgi:AcrR family transcriptional regulator
LQAAAEVIAEVGWGRVTTRAVAARAKLPHGAVSYHFRGKQDLLTEAALHSFEQAFPISEFESLETLPELVALFETWLGEHGSVDPVVAPVGMEAMFESGRDPQLRERLAETLPRYRVVLTGIVESAQQRGSATTAASPAAIATLMAALGDGLFLQARIDPRLDSAGALDALRALLTG